MNVFGAHTDRGRVKKVNQDAYCFMEADTPAGSVSMAIVCDGVGGLAKGELASATVVFRFSDWFERNLSKFMQRNITNSSLNWDSVKNVWQTILLSANDNIFRHGKESGDICGTTFTGMLTFGNEFLVGQVGDTRAYRVGAADVTQITEDQTYVAQQVSVGALTLEEAAHHPKRNMILQAVGTQSDLAPKFETGTYDKGDMFVLCCDGLYQTISVEDEAFLLRAACSEGDEQLSKTCRALVEEAIRRGEKDNITLVAFGEGVDGDSIGNQQKAKAELGKTARNAAASETTVALEDDYDSTTIILQASGGDAVDGEDALTVVVTSGSERLDDQDDEDDAPTTIIGDEDDAPTVVVRGGVDR